MCALTTVNTLFKRSGAGLLEVTEVSAGKGARDTQDLSPAVGGFLYSGCCGWRRPGPRVQELKGRTKGRPRSVWRCPVSRCRCAPGSADATGSDVQFLSVILASCHRHGRAPVFLAEPSCHVYCTVTSSHSQVTKF